MKSSHHAFFDWTYPSDQPEMHELYRRAKLGQWNGETYLPWHTSVDPDNAEIPVLPRGFINWSRMEEFGIRLTAKEEQRFTYDVVAWMLSQFLHGEQGALLAASQVTEAVQFFDGKLYGATQVVDEARHVEVFHRYLDQKLNKLYQINDNLFVIIDALMADSRWDMKFLGMQIMVEGLALGAFGTLYKMTKEPLLKELLKMVIQDEARHVHYGVVALREHFNNHLSPQELREREDWSFEVALLMRNRFLMWEIYEESFEHKLTREQWKEIVTTSPGLEEFRHVMFSRLVPNLREIGLLSDRIKPHYDEAGLSKYFGGAAADEITGDQMIAQLDAA
ncbi:MAG: ferritin-like domain-containing protein [Polyangiaceae bacterium]|nr:ferritin-like domain-containing protein [Polyangiaceae bacterium]